MMRLRRTQPDDEPFLWDMLALAVYTGPGQEAWSVEAVQRNAELRRYVDGWGRADDFGIVAETGGVPVGTAWARLMPADAPGYGYVDAATPELTIAVLPGFRGKGVGSRLLGELLATAEASYPALSLSVTRTNPARRLYRRFGFIVVAETASAVTMIHRF